MSRSPDKKSDPENWLLRREEVLRRLDISDPTLRREIAAGNFHEPLEIGRARRWRLSWLQEYLNRLEANGTKNQGTKE